MTDATTTEQARQEALAALARLESLAAEGGEGDLLTRTRSAVRHLGSSTPDESSAAPGRVTRVDHVGLIVRDLAQAVGLYVDVLGGRLVAGGVEHEHNVRSAFVTFPQGGKFELLCPVGPGGMQSFLEARGEGVHHVTLFTDDVVGTDARVREAGLSSVGLDLTDPVWQEMYVSPKSAHGCLLQVVQPSAAYDVARHADEMSLDDILNDVWVWKDRAPSRS